MGTQVVDWIQQKANWQPFWWKSSKFESGPREVDFKSFHGWLENHSKRGWKRPFDAIQHYRDLWFQDSSSQVPETWQGQKDSGQQADADVFTKVYLYLRFYFWWMRTESSDKWRDLWSRSEEWRWKGDGARWTIVFEDSDLKGENWFQFHCILHPKNFARTR